MRKFLFLAVAVSFFSCFFCLTTFAATAYDEAVQGELSKDADSPTPVSVAGGSNLISGSLDADYDLFQLTLSPSQQLDAILFQQYDVSEQEQSFFLVESGPQLSSFFTAEAALGSALVGRNPGTEVGDDLLAELARAPLGGSGFTTPLGPGTYTFWFQETGAPVNYTFNFVVTETVPEPATLLIALGSFLAFGFRQARVG